MLCPFLFFLNDPVIYWPAENPFHNKSLIPKISVKFSWKIIDYMSNKINTKKIILFDILCNGMICETNVFKSNFWKEFERHISALNILTDIIWAFK